MLFETMCPNSKWSSYYKAGCLESFAVSELPWQCQLTLVLIVCVAMVMQQVIGLMTDVRQMKDKIKETQQHQDHIDIL